jgi:chitin synthase
MDNETKDGVFILGTLYKETKGDINQLIDSVSADGYKNLMIVFMLDGEYCVDTLFNEVFEQESELLYQNEAISYNNNTINYCHHVHRGLQFLVIVKNNNAGKKDSQCIFYDMLNLDMHFNNMDHALHPLVRYLYQFVNIIDYKYMLLLDGDTIIENDNTVMKMVHIMNTFTDHIAICGTTEVLNKNENILTMGQHFEYFMSHLLLKTFNTLVLSGCFTMLRIHVGNDTLVNEAVLAEYNKTPTNLIEDNLLKFGEDRYLTSILINTYTDMKIKYVPAVKCITEVPASFKHLILQRRRWSNSLIACHIYLLQSKFISIGLYVVVVIELSVILLLPLLIIVGLIGFILTMSIQGYSALPVIITGNISLMNFYVTLISGKYRMLLYYFPFMVLSWMFTIIIPYDSILRFNVVEWNSVSDISSSNDNGSDDLSLDSANYILSIDNSI